MTNKKSTKKALFMSALSLLLCFSMLIGTTFAWFTDSVSTNNNIITGGNLDVELYWSTDAENWKKVTSETNVFMEKTLWEPGHTEVVYLKVKNEGSLALKYQLGVNIVNENVAVNVNDEPFKLSDFILYNITDGVTEFTSSADARGDESGIKLNTPYNKDAQLLKQGEEAVVTMVVFMPTTVDNDANYKTGTEAPVINLGINLYATQFTKEQDSFGPDYDEDAWNPDMIVNNAADLAKAIAEVKDGGIIALGNNLTFDEESRTHNSGTYYDGLYYIGDKSFTIDLNGKTITNDSAINDYLLNFKNSGAKPNTITIKNGTIEATNSAYCAIATSSTNTQKITINLENVNLIGNNSNGAVAKIRGGAELNVKAGTVITGKDSYVGIEAVGNNTVVNVYEGAKIYQNGTSSYVGSLIGVSYNATANVYGGYGKSAQGGFIAMTSGGTINVADGEWIANTNGAYANGNKSVLIAQSDKATYKGGNSVINVTGGTFKGGYNCYGNAAGDAQINISAGIFNADPSTYVASGFKALNNNGTYAVVPENVDAVILTAADLLALSGTKLNGTYELLADIDLGGAEFKAMSAWYKTVVFNGNGHTISNAKVVSGENDNGTEQASMFFVSTNGKLTVSDLTLKDITVTTKNIDNGYAAAVIGYCEGVAVLNNVDVVNANITGSKSSGLLIGHLTGTGSLAATDCDVAGKVTLSSFEANGHYAGKYIGTVAGPATLTDCTADVTLGGNLHANNIGVTYGRKTATGSVTLDSAIPVATTEELFNAIKNAPVGQTTTIVLTNSVYAGDLDITVAAMGKSGGDVVIKAANGVKPVITGTVTLGYRNQGVGATMYNANVTFEGITFDHAEAEKDSIVVQDVKSLTLKNCTIIGDGEYGLTCARGNATGASKIVGCTFENAAMQILGNYGTGLVIDDCEFNNSRVNVQAGNGVTIQNCEFNNTLTAANVGDSFYAIRSNSTPITVKDCKINIDSKLTEVATAQAKWYLLANRGTTNWTVENVAITLTDAALAQTELDITACTSTGLINTTNLTVNGVQK